MLLKIATLVLLTIVAVSAKDYTNYKLIQVTPKVADHVRLLAKLEHNPDFDVWNDIRDVEDKVDILLSPEAYEKYDQLFAENGLPHTVLHHNMQQPIDEERARQAMLSITSPKQPGRAWTSYPRYNDIVNTINGWATANPSYISVYSAGTSVQGRDLPVLKLNTGNTQKRVWFDCGIHAREWISPVTCLNVIEKLINGYNAGLPTSTALLNTFEIHVMPIHNPDGYEYTHTTDRYWRKSRKLNSGSTCLGVDLNRNYPFQWLTGGSSTDPCSDTYAGSSAGSEPETQAVINAINAASNWAAFVTIHSYGNWYLLPWGYTNNLPNDYTEQLRVARLSADAINSVNGEIFTVGTTANLLYIASGNSVDWAYGAKGIKYSYTFELRPRNGVGVFGFVLNANQIAPVADEIAAGVITLLQNV